MGTATSEPPAVALSFANNFWGKDDAGVGPLIERMTGAKQTCDELKSFYGARASIEEEYARKLLALSRKGLGTQETGSLKTSFDIVRGEVESMAKQHHGIAAQMKSELEEPLAAFSGGMKERRKIVQNTVEKLLKTKVQQTAHVNKTRDRYEQDCLKIKGYLAQGHMVMGQEERRNKAKLEKTQISVASSNTEYESAVKVLEETTARWNREWKSAADKFQDLEEERLDFTKSSLWTFANIASTVCVSDDASCEKMRLSLEKMDVERDIIWFITERGTGQEIPDAPRYINFCRGDINDAMSEASADESYSVAQFPRSINPAFRSSSPQPSTFESHHDPDSALANNLAHREPKGSKDSKGSKESPLSKSREASLIPQIPSPKQASSYQQAQPQSPSQAQSQLGLQPVQQPLHHQRQKHYQQYEQPQQHRQQLQPYQQAPQQFKQQYQQPLIQQPHQHQHQQHEQHPHYQHQHDLHQHKPQQHQYQQHQYQQHQHQQYQPQQPQPPQQEYQQPRPQLHQIPAQPQQQHWRQIQQAPQQQLPESPSQPQQPPTQQLQLQQFQQPRQVRQQIQHHQQPPPTRQSMDEHYQQRPQVSTQVSYDSSQHDSVSEVPHDPNPTDEMTMLCRTAPSGVPSDMSSQLTSARPSSRDENSDYSNSTSLSSMEPASGKVSPTKQDLVPTSYEKPIPYEKAIYEKPPSKEPSYQKPVHEAPVQEKPTAEILTHEQPASERLSFENHALVKPTLQKLTFDRPAFNRPAAETLTFEKSPLEKPTFENHSFEKPTFEKPTSERPSFETPTSEKPTSSKPAVHKPTFGRTISERPAVEKPTFNKPTFERPASRPVSPEKSSPEKTDKPEKHVLKKKSGFFQNHSPFRRKSVKELQSPVAQPTAVQSPATQSPVAQPSRNTWHVSQPSNSTTRRSQTYNAVQPQQPRMLLQSRTQSPEPIDANASVALGVGQNILPVNTHEGKQEFHDEPTAAESDPIAMALAELKEVTLGKESSVRMSADQYHGISTPVPGRNSSPLKPTPASRSTSPLPKANPRPSTREGGRVSRAGAPPSYQSQAPVSRLGVPPPAVTSKAMKEATKKAATQTRTIFGEGRGKASPSVYNPSSSSRPGTRGTDAPRAASPQPPRNPSPQPQARPPPQMSNSWSSRQSEHRAPSPQPSRSASPQPPLNSSWSSRRSEYAASPNPYQQTHARNSTSNVSTASAKPVSDQRYQQAQARSSASNVSTTPIHQPSEQHYQRSPAASIRGASPAPPRERARPQSSYSMRPQSSYSSNDMAMQLASVAGDPYGSLRSRGSGRPESRATGFYGDYGGGDNNSDYHQRSKSVADPSRQYTSDGRPILHYARALYLYQAAIPEELGFAKGDYLAVLRHQDDGWWEAEVHGGNGQVGLVPSNYLQAC